jgi:prepilin-type N-terminal cleavage/methylation domain-containing protein
VPGIAGSQRGLTLVELLFTISLLATITAIAIPLTSDAVDELRAANAVRYLEGRILNARMEAVKRSTAVALRFEAFAPDYLYGTYVDGNGNGVRTADIARGVDWCLTPAERLGDKFPGVTFGLAADVPDLEGSRASDGVRIGTPRILTMTANGTATSGTLYVKGKGAQYAVRVLGATGRTRVFRYDTGVQRWIAR